MPCRPETQWAQAEWAALGVGRPSPGLQRAARPSVQAGSWRGTHTGQVMVPRMAGIWGVAALFEKLRQDGEVIVRNLVTELLKGSLSFGGNLSKTSAEAEPRRKGDACAYLGTSRGGVW